MMIGDATAARDAPRARQRSARRAAEAAPSRGADGRWTTAASPRCATLTSTSAPARSSASPASRATARASWSKSLAGQRAVEPGARCRSTASPTTRDAPRQCAHKVRMPARGAAAQRLRRRHERGRRTWRCATSTSAWRARRLVLMRRAMRERARELIAEYRVQDAGPRARRSAACRAATCSAPCWRASWPSEVRGADRRQPVLRPRLRRGRRDPRAASCRRATRRGRAAGQRGSRRDAASSADRIVVMCDGKLVLRDARRRGRPPIARRVMGGQAHRRGTTRPEPSGGRMIDIAATPFDLRLRRRRRDRAGHHRHAARLHRARRLRRSLGNDVTLLAGHRADRAPRCSTPGARAGLLVVHTRESHQPDLSDCPPAKRLRGAPHAAHRRSRPDGAHPGRRRARQRRSCRSSRRSTARS